jgi:hypothetical protein
LFWYNLGVTYSGIGEQSEVIKIYEKLKVLDAEWAAKFFKDVVLP